MNNFTQEEWGNENINKYFIYYDDDYKVLEISGYFTIRHINEIYFRTKEEAHNFINKYENQILHEMGIE